MQRITLFLFFLLLTVSCSQQKEKHITINVPSDKVHSACLLGDSLLILVRRVKNEADTSSNNFTSDLYLFDANGKLLHKIKTPNCKSVVYDDGKIYTSNYSALYVYDTGFELVETIDFPRKMNNIVCKAYEYQRTDSMYVVIIATGVEGEDTVRLNGSEGYRLKKTKERLDEGLYFTRNLDYIDFHIHKKTLYVQNKKYHLL
ncbi:hypothetical protein [Bernardetia sp.]|uniref:hypothetical protein n=1 Tax=Bernardetia sp. TaxID=1937974 RepID=UPI0025B8D928|nr:hypothetical protein [Bernardetia sp.]